MFQFAFPFRGGDEAMMRGCEGLRHVVCSPPHLNLEILELNRANTNAYHTAIRSMAEKYAKTAAASVSLIEPTFYQGSGGEQCQADFA
jgi:hypothetical protein